MFVTLLDFFLSLPHNELQLPQYSKPTHWLLKANALNIFKNVTFIKVVGCFDKI